MRRALVTGVTGQDGSYLAELLVASGREVVGMVRDPSADAPNLAAVADDVTLVSGDLSDPAGLRRLVADVAPDELFHLAAPTFVPASWADPATTLAEIAGATATLLAAAEGTGMRVVVASSSEVFGDAGESPQRETSPMRPWSPYGVAKLAAHRLVGAYRRAGLHATSAITFNHESPRRPERFLPRKVTRGAAAIALGLEAELTLGSMDAVRDWSAAQDVVRGQLLAIERETPDDYVFASGVGRTVGDLVDRRVRPRRCWIRRATSAWIRRSCARRRRRRRSAIRRTHGPRWAGSPRSPSRTSSAAWSRPTSPPCADASAARTSSSPAPSPARQAAASIAPRSTSRETRRLLNGDRETALMVDAPRRSAPGPMFSVERVDWLAGASSTCAEPFDIPRIASSASGRQSVY